MWSAENSCSQSRLVMIWNTQRNAAKHCSRKKSPWSRYSVYNLVVSGYSEWKTATLTRCAQKSKDNPTTTVIIRINAAAFIKFLALNMRRLFRGSVYCKPPCNNSSEFIVPWRCFTKASDRKNEKVIWWQILQCGCAHFMECSSC